jgi:hypothetical protein
VFHLFLVKCTMVPLFFIGFYLGPLTKKSDHIGPQSNNGMLE